MNVIEHLLTCLGEECAEVTKDTSKANRFGLSDRDISNPSGPTNRERIVNELNDLMGVVRLLQSSGALPPNIWDEGKQIAKMKRVERFMHYAENVGALTIS